MSKKVFHNQTNLRAAVCVLGTVILLNGALGRAEEAKDDEIVTPLMAKELTGIGDKEALMLTVEYLPGGASLPHRHDSHVFVYVLEGSLVTQVAGQSAVTLKSGQTFYENPQDIHTKSANASATEPVKFLVFMIKDKGKPPVLPASGN